MSQKNEIGGRKGLTSAANWTVRIVGSVILAILTWYALRYTQYMSPGGREIPTNIRDSMKSNIVFAIGMFVIFLCLFGLERHLDTRVQQAVVHAAVLLAMVWIGSLGLWWIQAVDRVPEGDQAFLYGGASYFLEGQYMFLDKGGYCSMYPHQLGLIALTELLFLVVGTMNYFAFQVICVILAVGIVYLGYRVVSETTGHAAVVIAYCLMSMCCLPLVFYTGWVYGDIPSIFFALLASNMLLMYSKKGKKRYLAALIFAMTMALLVRKNSLLLLVALCLVIGVYAIEKRDKRLILAALLSIVIPYLAYMGIYKMYEIRSGHERYDAIPTLSWISMGMQENQGAYGWYYDYAKAIYYANDCDARITNEIVKQDIRDRIQVFRQDPSYALTFYREKVLSQWNEPLYQSLYFSNKYVDAEHAPAPDSFVAKISNEYFPKVLWFCDRLQFWVYLGMMFYFMFAVKRDSNILQHLLAVAMIGGFFFSILWEAKARYILPYYITMFPCAVIGYEQMLHVAAGILRRAVGGRGGDRSEEIDQTGRAA